MTQGPTPTPTRTCVVRPIARAPRFPPWPASLYRPPTLPGAGSGTGKVTWPDAARAVPFLWCVSMQHRVCANPANAAATPVRIHRNHGDSVDPAGHQVRARAAERAGAGDSAVARRGGWGSLGRSADAALWVSSRSCVGCHRVLHLPKSAWSWTCICGCENDYFNTACVNLQCRKPRPAEFRVRGMRASPKGFLTNCPNQPADSTWRARRLGSRASRCRAARSAAP